MCREGCRGKWRWPLYTKLLVWHWLLPQGFGPTPALPKIPSSGIQWIPVAYIAWLCCYFIVIILEVAVLRAWLYVNQASEYTWSAAEREVFDDVCRSFALSRVPTVYQVEANMPPFTFRWWRPVIVLPSGFYRGSSDRSELRAVLAHEVAHIKYGHLGINSLLSLVVWLFPLSRLSLWRANRSLRQEMELVADIAAVQTGKADEWVLKSTLRRHACEHRLPSTLGFAVLLVRRLDRDLQAPPARSRRHVWVIPVFAAVSQLNFIMPPLSIAGPLVAASIAPQLVTSLRPFTDAQPLYQPNYFYQIPVYQPARLYIDPELLRRVPSPQIDYTALRQLQMPRFDTQVLRYQNNPIPVLPYSPPAFAFTPMPSISVVPPRVDLQEYHDIPSNSIPMVPPPPAFNPGINTNALPAIEAPAIPKSKQ
jgi:hypothetical protein